MNSWTISQPHWAISHTHAHTHTHFWAEVEFLREMTCWMAESTFRNEHFVTHQSPGCEWERFTAVKICKKQSSKSGEGFWWSVHDLQLGNPWQTIYVEYLVIFFFNQVTKVSLRKNYQFQSTQLHSTGFFFPDIISFGKMVLVLLYFTSLASKV